MIKWLENKIRKAVDANISIYRKYYVSCDKCGVVLAEGKAKKVKIDHYGGHSTSTTLPCIYYCDRHAPKYDLKIDCGYPLNLAYDIKTGKMINYDRYYKSNVEVDESGKPVKEKSK